MKIVINTCYGGFDLSRKAFLKLRKLGSKIALSEPDIGKCWPNSKQKRAKHYDNFCTQISRTDPLLIQVIEELGSEKCSGPKYVKI